MSGRAIARWLSASVPSRARSCCGAAALAWCSVARARRLRPRRGTRAERRPADRHARLRRARLLTPDRRSAGAGAGDGDEPADAQRRRSAPRYGGGFVQSIDGLSGGQEAAGDPVDWFYYVNGVEAPKGAAATNVHPGDHIWWDLHDWSQTEDVPAVVGSFPEPFLNGIEGKRLPVRVECAPAERRLSHGDRAAARARRPGRGRRDRQRRRAGDAARARRPVDRRCTATRACTSIERGPRASGVYARFAGDGQTLTLLDGDGRSDAHARRRRRADRGHRDAKRRPCGSSPAPTTRAWSLPRARSTRAALHDRFALALDARPARSCRCRQASAR